MFGAGYLVIMSIEVVGGYVRPFLAHSAPGYVNDVLAVATGGTAAGDIGQMQTLIVASGIAYLAGGFIFGIALFRADVLSRSAAALRAVGTVTIAIPLLPQINERLFAIPIGVAWSASATRCGASTAPRPPGPCPAPSARSSTRPAPDDRLDPPMNPKIRSQHRVSSIEPQQEPVMKQVQVPRLRTSAERDRSEKGVAPAITQLPLWQLNLLRVGYFVMGAGLAVVKWALLLNHGPWEANLSQQLGVLRRTNGARSCRHPTRTRPHTRPPDRRPHCCRDPTTNPPDSSQRRPTGTPRRQPRSGRHPVRSGLCQRSRASADHGDNTPQIISDRGDESCRGRWPASPHQG